MGVDSLLPAPASTETSGAGVNFSDSFLNDASKKIRKPYTITKSRQNWTDIEHDKFLEALHLFDRDWKKIEAFVGSKTAIQIRSHAQKYFLKVQKSGTNEHVPPPRPKRKAARPYPHKAPENDTPKAGGMLVSSAHLIEPGDVMMIDSYSWPTNPHRGPAFSSWKDNTLALVDAATQDDVRSSGAAVSHNCCSSSIESGPGLCRISETHNQQAQRSMTGRVMPDFPKVYRFIGSVFDPNESDHLQKLKIMDPVDVETVVLLMKNLCANLKSPEFEDYRRFFSSYDTETGKIVSSSSVGSLQALTGTAIPSS